jgi:hypothetical protein
VTGLIPNAQIPRRMLRSDVAADCADDADAPRGILLCPAFHYKGVRGASASSAQSAANKGYVNFRTGHMGRSVCRGNSGFSDSRTCFAIYEKLLQTTWVAVISLVGMLCPNFQHRPSKTNGTPMTAGILTHALR